MALTLNAVQDLIPPSPSSAAGQAAPLRHHLARTAVVVVVMGVLPFVLAAPAAWQVIGTLVSVALVARSLQLIWQAFFSTDPRHLTAPDGSGRTAAPDQRSGAATRRGPGDD